MTRTSRTIVVLAATAVLTLSGGPSALTFAGGDPGGNSGASGPDALTRAAEAALAASGGGRVTATEVDDDETWFEIEVTLDDGRQVDVQLDRSLTVVRSAPDVELPGTGD